MTRIICQSDYTDAQLRSHGCGAASVDNALMAASDGGWRPTDPTASARIRVARSGATPARFRARGLTSTEVYQSLAAVTASDVRMDVPLKRYRGGDVRTMLAKRAEVGGVLVIAVRYGVIQDAGHGVGRFRLGHWVDVLDQDGDRVVIADPLRRQTTRWPVSVLVDAAESFGTRPWGDGRGEAILVYPWLTWRQGYAGMRVKRDAALKAKDAAVAALEACQASGGTDPEALAAARAKGIADAAANAAATR